MQKVSLALIAIIAGLIPLVVGHGMVLDPIGRGSRWRCNGKVPTNYDDNGLYCGGYDVQWNKNNGKCGVCGDNYADPKPRVHELGGKYGQGEIVRNYTKGAVITVAVRITANHRGYFVFSLCDLSKNAKETDECFDRYPLLDSTGNRNSYLNSTAAGMYYVNVQLPRDLVCVHCILQWTYVAGNNWGYCSNGTGKLGCGPQENFRACSDIGIYNASDPRLAGSYNYCSVSTRSPDWIFNNIPEEEYDGNMTDTV